MWWGGVGRWGGGREWEEEGENGGYGGCGGGVDGIVNGMGLWIGNIKVMYLIADQ